MICPRQSSRKRLDIASMAAQWARIRGRLQSEVGDIEYRNWLRQMTLAGVDGDEVTVLLPTRFLCDWVRSRYGDRLNALWQAENPAVRRVEIRVGGAGLDRRSGREPRRAVGAGSRCPHAARGTDGSALRTADRSAFHLRWRSWSASPMNSLMPARDASPSSHPARASIRCSCMAASVSARRI